MADIVQQITITDSGGSRRVVIDGQTYVRLHAAYQMAADARADQDKRARGDERARIMRECESTVREVINTTEIDHIVTVNLTDQLIEEIVTALRAKILGQQGGNDGR